MPVISSVMRLVASCWRLQVIRVTNSTVPSSLVMSGYCALHITGCLRGSYSCSSPRLPPHEGTMTDLSLRAAIIAAGVSPELRISSIVIPVEIIGLNNQNQYTCRDRRLRSIGLNGLLIW